MSEVWLYLKKSLPCKPDSSEVHDPKASAHHRNYAQRKNQGKSTDCSNIKDFINGSLSCSEKLQSSTPKSQASNAMLNPVTHEIVLDNTSGEIKFSPCYPCSQSIGDGTGVEGSRRSSTKRITIASMKTHCVDCDECNIFKKPKVTVLKDSPAFDKQKSLDTIEEHDFSEHSVIQLHRQDSSWQIIKKICEASYVNGESKTAHIECVLKVQNTQETFACFEECREMIKINAERLQNKHPRCMVDGNELLRFHGTTIACSLGINGSSTTLCILDQCGVCQILRHGFSANHEFHGTVGVFTTSTCGKAIDSIRSSNNSFMRKCVIVCRVIAGRINNPLQEIQEMNDLGYDSLVRKISGQSDIEELSVLNPGAVLPCFVVIYRFLKVKKV